MVWCNEEEGVGVGGVSQTVRTSALMESKSFLFFFLDRGRGPTLHSSTAELTKKCCICYPNQYRWREFIDKLQ